LTSSSSPSWPIPRLASNSCTSSRYQLDRNQRRLRRPTKLSRQLPLLLQFLGLAKCRSPLHPQAG
jgi:hypothetical protein